MGLVYPDRLFSFDGNLSDANIYIPGEARRAGARCEFW